MPRKKVKLAWIENETARRASLKKRRSGLMKKVMELTTLCGVEGMCLIYGTGEQNPTVWPSHDVARQLLTRFLSLPEVERSKKMVDQERYLRDSILKAQENHRRELRKLRNMELMWLMDEFHHGRGLEKMELYELETLAWLVEDNVLEIRKLIELAESDPEGRVEEAAAEEAEDKKPDLDPVSVEMVNRGIEEIQRRLAEMPSGVVAPPGSGDAEKEGDNGSGTLGGPDMELRLGRDDEDHVGPAADDDRRGDDEVEKVPGGGGGGGLDVKVKEECESG